MCVLKRQTNDVHRLLWVFFFNQGRHSGVDGFLFKCWVVFSFSFLKYSASAELVSRILRMFFLLPICQQKREKAVRDAFGRKIIGSSVDNFDR